MNTITGDDMNRFWGRSKSRWLVASLCFVLAALAPARGDDDDAEPDVPLNELFRSGMVFPQAKGESQWTLAPAFSSNRSINSLSTPLSFEYGVTDTFQFEIAWEQDRAFDRLGQTPRGIENALSVGLQYSWIDIAGSRLHFALAGELETIVQRQQLVLANSQENEDEHRTSFTPSAIFAATVEEFGDLYLFVEAGAEFNGGEQEAFVNLGGAIPFNSVALSLEWNWSDEDQFLTPGITYKFGGGWELGLGAGLGLEKDSDTYQLLLNLIYEY